MKREYAKLSRDGFSACFYPAPQGSDRCVIILMSYTGDDIMNKWCAKYLNACGCHALGLGKWQDRRKENGVYEWPLEYVERAVQWLRKKGIRKIGITGCSMGANMSLSAAARIPDISLAVIFCPSDVVWEGVKEGKWGGKSEWGTGTSLYTWRGSPLPYQPYYLTGEQYWDTYQKSSKAHKELRSAEIFRHSENTRPVPEACFIPVENIRGKLLLFASEDDALWDAAKYVRRMEQRLKDRNFAYPVECHIYTYGTHFIFPETLLSGSFAGRMMPKVFVSGRQHPEECKQSRIQVDEAVRKALAEW